MKWYKVEDYPVGSDECVLASSTWENKRFAMDCFVARKRDDYWLVDNEEYYIDSSDRWCHIDLPED